MLCECTRAHVCMLCECTCAHVCMLCECTCAHVCMLCECTCAHFCMLCLDVIANAYMYMDIYRVNELTLFNIQMEDNWQTKKIFLPKDWTHSIHCWDNCMFKDQLYIFIVQLTWAWVYEHVGIQQDTNTHFLSSSYFSVCK